MSSVSLNPHGGLQTNIVLPSAMMPSPPPPRSQFAQSPSVNDTIRPMPAFRMDDMARPAARGFFSLHNILTLLLSPLADKHAHSIPTRALRVASARRSSHSPGSPKPFHLVHGGRRWGLFFPPPPSSSSPEPPRHEPILIRPGATSHAMSPASVGNVALPVIGSTRTAPKPSTFAAAISLSHPASNKSPAASVSFIAARCTIASDGRRPLSPPLSPVDDDDDDNDEGRIVRRLPFISPSSS